MPFRGLPMASLSMSLAGEDLVGVLVGLVESTKLLQWAKSSNAETEHNHRVAGRNPRLQP